MTDYKIVRGCSGSLGTFGIFSADNVPLCITCELPWANNESDTSCIPIGSYQVDRHISAKFPLGNTWEIQDVPDRTGILIHAANDMDDLEGCVAVGQYFGFLNGLPAVLNSGFTLSMLNVKLPDSFIITIS